MEIAKIFQNGRSQAVRLPKKYRFQTKTVAITKRGKCVILSPKEDISWDDFFLNYACPDFEVDREDVQKPQARELF